MLRIIAAACSSPLIPTLVRFAKVGMNQLAAVVSEAGSRNGALLNTMRARLVTCRAQVVVTCNFARVSFLIFDGLLRQMQAASGMNHPVWLNSRTASRCFVLVSMQLTVIAQQSDRSRNRSVPPIEEMTCSTQLMYWEFASRHSCAAGSKATMKGG